MENPGLESPDRDVIRDTLQLQNDSDLDPLLVCLRMLIRKCVCENANRDDIQKLIPTEVSPEIQRLLTLLLQKFHREWREDISKDQLQSNTRPNSGETDVNFPLAKDRLETMLEDFAKRSAVQYWLGINMTCQRRNINFSISQTIKIVCSYLSMLQAELDIAQCLKNWPLFHPFAGRSIQNQCVNTERSNYSGTVRGTIHVVVGGGGSRYWSLSKDYDWGFVKLTSSNHSSLLFEYKKSRDGRVHDSFTISRDYRDVPACVHDGCEASTLAH